MKKTKLTRSLLAACSIVALSAVMYGCAHTDSGPSQDELDAANEATAAAAAKADVDAAAAATAAEEAAAASATAAEEAAAASATAAEEAAAAAATAAEEAAAASATAAEEAAAASATAAEEAAAASATAAEEAAAAAATAADDAEAARQAAQDEADRLQGEADDAAAKAAVAKAEGLFKAIRAAVKADVADDYVFSFAEDEDGVPGPGLNSPVLDGDEADKDKPLKLADSLLVTSRGMDTMVAFDEHFMDSEDGRLELVSLTHEAMAMADRFPETGTVTYGTESDTTEAFIFPGTMMGAAGKFHCTETTANDCTISKTADGYSFMMEKWYFTADVGETVTLPDDDYTGYGWWAHKTDVGAFVVDAFTVASTGASRIAADAEPVGTATYEGGAAGKFAIDNRPLGTTLEAGHFTATATLTADFDENVAGVDGNSISGTVDQFVANDVERPGWEVTLGATDITFGDANTDHFSLHVPGDPGGETDNTANLWMIDDVPGVLSGNWRGNFYNDGDARNDGTPEVVIGTFSVSHGSEGEVAHMIGAFQAHNSHADTPSTDN